MFKIPGDVYTTQLQYTEAKTTKNKTNLGGSLPVKWPFTIYNHIATPIVIVLLLKSV